MRARTLALLSLISLPSCSGGGGGGGGPAPAGFQLAGLQYGRPYDDGSGARVVSPLTTTRTDPRTGAEIPGSLEVLHGSVTLDDRVSVALDEATVAPVVPRNAVFVLLFDAPVDPASVVAEQIDAGGQVTASGSVFLRLSDGTPWACSLAAKGAEVWVDPVVGDQLGLPATPVAFDARGEALLSTEGFVHLFVPTEGTRVLRSTNGSPLIARPDGRGVKGIGLNPGNRIVDFISAGDLAPVLGPRGGFLPDGSPPRIVRTHRLGGSLDFSAGDGVGFARIIDVHPRFDTFAHDGLGEWVGGTLILRPGRQGEERRAVVRNTVDTVFVSEDFTSAPQHGDLWTLTRPEFFEPDPSNPIDPELFDSNNPQNPTNRSLHNFVVAREIDAHSGNPIGPELALGAPLPAYCELCVRFSEAMSPDSTTPWEGLQLRFDPAGAGSHKPTRLLLGESGRLIRIQPVASFSDGSVDVVGWGPGVQNLSLVMTVVPSVTYLQPRVSPDTLMELLDSGVRGPTDLGGRAPAFPSSMFDAANPTLVFEAAVATDESISSRSPAPRSDDWGVVVHRFQGRPMLTTGDDTGRSGARFRDHDEVYWPAADVNVLCSGFLSPHPVSFLTKVHDDQNPPPDGPLGAFSNGTSTPLTSFSPQPGPHDGARLQHVFRDVEASPGGGLAGSLFDLYRVSWCPIGVTVTEDSYEDLSIHAAHSSFRPITHVSSGTATEPGSGLSEAFDFATFSNWFLGSGPACPGAIPIEGPNHYPGDYLTCLPAGTTYKIAPDNLYTPAGTTRQYLAWPEFERPFAYNNGELSAGRRQTIDDFNAAAGSEVWIDRREQTGQYDNRGGDSLLLEYRIRPQATSISGQNGFTFNIGVAVSRFPYFRVFSRGEATNPLFPDAIGSDPRARCATANSGLNPVESGDNSRYFTVFDYRKHRSLIRSPFVEATTSGTGPTYVGYFLDPPRDHLPTSTQVWLKFQGGLDAAGAQATGWSDTPSVADGKSHISFRADVRGDLQSGIAPSLDTVAIYFRR